ncbi:sensor histidine kinase [Corynebacterium pacaense]|uniref:sensor histidine kinase n=1 Tax=Corynebacterium pacaense TaxID=1816684 RepID=UPI0009BB2B49|nr:HAMP domain-containing sensor histidine kinase [Corynebacterium pacaense]
MTRSANPYVELAQAPVETDAEERISRVRAAGRTIPLRTRIILLVVGIAGLGLFVNAVAVSSLMREVSYSRVDQDLETAMNSWARTVELLSSDGDKQGPPSDYYVAKVFPDGSSIIFNDAQSAPDLAETEIGTGPHTVSAAEGSASSTHWRVTASRSGDVITVVGRSLGRESTLLYRLTLVQLVIGVLVLVAITITAFFMVRRSLLPLRQVEETAVRIARGDLDRRVPQWPMSTEVGQLANALNIMLEQLQASILHAQEKEAQMRRFVGDASHELRTPLTSVKGYAELYHSGATRDADWVLSKIGGEAQRMSVLVEDLLALTRAEGQQMDRHPVDLLELSLAVTSSMRAAWPERSINVVNNAGTVPVVEGDPTRLHQVLTNLVNNGLNHGGPDAQVTIDIGTATGQVVVKVRDDGVGMSEEDAAHIFERFYRADVSRSRASGGSGLGLAITKSLVEGHGGTITVSSSPGVGTTFTVTLPALEEH